MYYFIFSLKNDISLHKQHKEVKHWIKCEIWLYYFKVSLQYKVILINYMYLLYG